MLSPSRIIYHASRHYTDRAGISRPAIQRRKGGPSSAVNPSHVHPAHLDAAATSRPCWIESSSMAADFIVHQARAFIGRRSTLGVPGRLVERASVVVVRRGDLAGATTDSRSKYDCCIFWSGDGILICGGFGRSVSASLLYRNTANRTILVPNKYYMSLASRVGTGLLLLTYSVISKSKKITLAKKLRTIEMHVAKFLVMLFA